MRKIYLNPAELFIAEQPTLITTVLGSCVSVVLFCRKQQIGAICHAVLPSGRTEDPNRFVDQSIAHMMAYFQRRNLRTADLISKLFGGADMFSLIDPAGRERTVGAQNVRMALACLDRFGLPPVAVDTGGQQGRKLIFHSHTGDVFLKRIRKERLPNS